MNLFKRWYLSKDLRNIRGQFNKLPEIKQRAELLDSVMSRLNIPMYRRESLKFDTFSIIMKRYERK